MNCLFGLTERAICYHHPICYRYFDDRWRLDLYCCSTGRKAKERLLLTLQRWTILCRSPFDQYWFKSDNQHLYSIHHCLRLMQRCLAYRCDVWFVHNRKSHGDSLFLVCDRSSLVYAFRVWYLRKVSVGIDYSVNTFSVE